MTEHPDETWPPEMSRLAHRKALPLAARTERRGKPHNRQRIVLIHDSSGYGECQVHMPFLLLEADTQVYVDRYTDPVDEWLVNNFTPLGLDVAIMISRITGVGSVTATSQNIFRLQLWATYGVQHLFDEIIGFICVATGLTRRDYVIGVHILDDEDEADCIDVDVEADVEPESPPVTDDPQEGAA
jgi:hypothetical protein